MAQIFREGSLTPRLLGVRSADPVHVLCTVRRNPTVHSTLLYSTLLYIQYKYVLYVPVVPYSTVLVLNLARDHHTTHTQTAHSDSARKS